MGWSDRVDRILEEGKLTLDPENSGFGGIYPSSIAAEVGLVGDGLGPVGNGGWVELIGSLDSPSKYTHLYTHRLMWVFFFGENV